MNHGKLACLLDGSACYKSDKLHENGLIKWFHFHLIMTLTFHRDKLDALVLQLSVLHEIIDLRHWYVHIRILKATGGHTT